MRFGPPTPRELQTSFQRVVDGITNGQYVMVPMGFGFNNQVEDALNAWALTPNHPATLLASARVALAQQLSEAS